MNTNSEKPFLGFGLGLRTEHYDDIIEQKPEDIDWFEIISENFLTGGGKPAYYLDKIRQDYPIIMHGVSMSLGSTDELDFVYLKQLKDLADRIEPAWFSDHLCWTGVDHKNTHDLLPLPYTEESIAHVADRIQQAQEYMGLPMLIENLSSYITYKHDTMTEWEFLSAIVERADCYILLDINNIYVSAYNHGFDPMEYIKNVPADRVWQHHLAGHENNGNLIVDTHDHPVIDDVWDLYRLASEYLGPVSTMIERDDNIPPLNELIAELNKARDIAMPNYQAKLNVG